MCSQSRTTPASQTAGVRDTQKPYRDCFCCGHSAPFSKRRECFSWGKKRPLYSSWASNSETPVCMHNANATVGVSPCNSISAILGQHRAYPNRDDNERTRPVPTPFVRTSQPIRPHFVPLDLAHGTYDASLTYISDDVVLFGLPPSPFSQWTPSPFTVDPVEYDCAE